MPKPRHLAPVTSTRRRKTLRCLKRPLAEDGAPTARQEEYGDADPTAAADALPVTRLPIRVLSLSF